MKRDDLWQQWYELLGDTADLLRDGVARTRPTLAERAANVERLFESEHRQGSRAAVRSETTTVPVAAPDPPGQSDPGLLPQGDAAARGPLPPAAPREEREAALAALAETVRACTLCRLSLGRTNAVPGTGVIDPLVMVVGEGPGAEEDRSGLPFVGRAGQYLDKWLESIGLSRETNAYIANIVKCRPPGNRDPQEEETAACLPYLEQQIELVRPRLIMTAGRISMRVLTGTSSGITRVHGTFFTWRGIPVVPTFHPSAVLRNPQWRRPVWEDLKRVRGWLIDNAGHTAPPLPGESGSE